MLVGEVAFLGMELSTLEHEQQLARAMQNEMQADAIGNEQMRKLA